MPGRDAGHFLYILGLSGVGSDEADLLINGKGKADPDDEEGDKTVKIESFMKVEQPQKKLERGIDIH